MPGPLARLVFSLSLVSSSIAIPSTTSTQRPSTSTSIEMGVEVGSTLELSTVNWGRRWRRCAGGGAGECNLPGSRGGGGGEGAPEVREAGHHLGEQR